MISYMWNFKPNETKNPSMVCINNNKKFIDKYQIVEPNDILPLLSSFEELSDLWNKIPDSCWVIKADIGRLLYIYTYGGLYLDIDCALKNNIVDNKNIKNDTLVLFTESIVSLDMLGPRESKNPKNTLRIANYAFFANCKNHPFLKLCINECIKRLKYLLELKLDKWQITDILWVCGPDVITTMYHEHKSPENPSILLMEIGSLHHLCYGSWRN